MSRTPVHPVAVVKAFAETGPPNLLARDNLSVPAAGSLIERSAAAF